jgi:anthranilate synthase component 2
MFLLIDNFDSFTFNVVQTFQQQGKDPLVLKNDDPRILELAESPELKSVCISPGPSRPENAGLCLKFLERLPKETPVLGICLGHQILGHFAGAEVVVADRIMHGKTSTLQHDGKGLFAGVPESVTIGRYHSLLVKAEGVDKLEITARSEEGEVMGLRYKDRPWFGLQFHPESVLTPEGPAMLAHFPQDLS